MPGTGLEPVTRGFSVLHKSLFFSIFTLHKNCLPQSYPNLFSQTSIFPPLVLGSSSTENLIIPFGYPMLDFAWKPQFYVGAILCSFADKNPFIA